MNSTWKEHIYAEHDEDEKKIKAREMVVEGWSNILQNSDEGPSYDFGG